MQRELGNMPTYRTPATNLTLILAWKAPAHIVATVPLEPAARIVRIDPAFRSPDGKRLGCIHAETVECWIMLPRTELRSLEPSRRKLIATIRQIPAAEDTQREHLSRHQIRLEVRMEIPTYWLGTDITVSLLHRIVYYDYPFIFWHRLLFAFTLTSRITLFNQHETP